MRLQTCNNSISLAADFSKQRMPFNMLQLPMERDRWRLKRLRLGGNGWEHPPENYKLNTLSFEVNLWTPWGQHLTHLTQRPAKNNTLSQSTWCANRESLRSSQLQSMDAKPCQVEIRSERTWWGMTELCLHSASSTDDLRNYSTRFVKWTLEVAWTEAWGQPQSSICLVESISKLKVVYATPWREDGSKCVRKNTKNLGRIAHVMSCKTGQSRDSHCVEERKIKKCCISEHLVTLSADCELTVCHQRDVPTAMLHKLQTRTWFLGQVTMLCQCHRRMQLEAEPLTRPKHGFSSLQIDLFFRSVKAFPNFPLYAYPLIPGSQEKGRKANGKIHSGGCVSAVLRNLAYAFWGRDQKLTSWEFAFWAGCRAARGVWGICLSAGSEQLDLCLAVTPKKWTVKSFLSVGPFGWQKWSKVVFAKLIFQKNPRNLILTSKKPAVWIQNYALQQKAEIANPFEGAGTAVATDA